MGFDPNQPFEKIADAKPSAFDPNQPFEKVGDAKPQEQRSMLGQIKDALDAPVRAVTEHSHTPLSFVFNPEVQQVAAKGLGYLSGLTRTAVAAPTGGVTMDDAKNALKGSAPGLGQYLKQAGVPEGPKIPLTNISMRDAGGFAGDVALDPLLGAGALEGKAGAVVKDMSGQGINDATTGIGKSMYKSGLKAIDEEAAKYGKDAPSDLLMRERVTGSKPSIAQQMDDLASQRLRQRDAILGRANDAETDVNRSLEPAENYIAGMNEKAKFDPRLNPLISKMQAQVDLLKSTAGRRAVPSQPEIRMSSLTPELMELPVSQKQLPLTRGEFEPVQPRLITKFDPQPEVAGYDAPTMKAIDRAGTLDPVELFNGLPKKGISGTRPVINNPVDSVLNLPVGGEYNKMRPAPYELAQVHPEVVLSEATPAIPGKLGPNPAQMSQVKTNTYNTIGDEAFNQAKRTPAFKQFQKVLANGQKEETERTVGDYLGPEAQRDLIQKNTELGQLLTTQERAEKEAAIYGRKNNFSSVDGMLAGAGLAGGEHSASIWALAAKKAADLAKESYVRTNMGLLTSDFGKTPIPAGIVRQSVTNNNPWKSKDDNK